MPDKAVVTHDGSGQTYELPLAWRTTATGGRSAESTFQIPQAAKLGVYATVGLVYADGRTLDGGSFRVEAFRLPVLSGTLSTAKDPKAKGSALVAPGEVPVGVEIHYLNGGGAAGLPVRVSALLREKPVNFADFDEFSFQPPRAQDERATVDDEDSEDTSGESREKLVADKLPVTLDKDGNGKVTVKDMPKITTPGDLVLEAGFADPNGEIQTLRQTVPVWPCCRGGRHPRRQLGVGEPEAVGAGRGARHPGQAGGRYAGAGQGACAHHHVRPPARGGWLLSL